MTAELEIRNLVRAFGGNRAIDDCSLSIRSGSITGIIGPNGAGKSTLFNVISGVLPANAGQIYFRGHRIDGLTPHRISNLGIARTFQTPREIGNSTTLDNMMLVPSKQWGERLLSLVYGWSRIRSEERENSAASLEVLRRVEIEHQRDVLSGRLSIGQKKLLELARCMLAHPHLALLDEPTAGVNPRLIGDLTDAMRQMSRAGVTLVIIEHNIDLVMNLCEHIAVLHRGRLLRQGTPAEVQNDSAVQDAYLGAGV